MESKLENKVVIFSSITDAGKAYSILEKEGAPNKLDKEVWLLRESSIPGLLTISFFSSEHNDFVHRRLGFVGGEWKFGPQEYHKAQEFSKHAEVAFSKSLPEKSLDSLVKLLTDHGFDICNQVTPKHNESSQNAKLIAYTVSAFAELSTITNSYTTDL
ncbi:hypothetical protein DGG96_17225 [Legionella qingyii]|uniref:Uncharacterized protein n=1 Tax=Legionella qingyii TaxID=2184757 RepID=A0A317U0U2_9GAMM|nr:hypothetical protein [Legionella qingyii]PWY54417.1 hypothetical protein DGG96_17225 [Legionella qingyii]RUR22853.1 hypothetical protein ELY20_09025 [Legionella qingyii]RUR22999.1 hypothetical protein ELY16_13890 [Legionella qingyii]